jgi:hypothetical protein
VNDEINERFAEAVKFGWVPEAVNCLLASGHYATSPGPPYIRLRKAMRKSLRSKPWTDADDDRIRDFVKQGVSVLRAASALGRTTQSVRRRARTIGSSFPTRSEARKKFAGDPQSSWRYH